MRFVDFLKTTVLLSAGAATALAAVTVLAAATHSEESLAADRARLVGDGRDRRPAPRQARRNEPADRAPAREREGVARRSPSMRPSAILLNRLWPLLLFTLVAGGLAFLAPQVPGIATGFAIIWALAWRRQDAAVAAIEERDGASFYVRRTSPLRPMALERTPGFKALRPERTNGAVT